MRVMIKRWAGAVLAALLFAAAAPRAARAERPRILVLPVVGKGADAAFRQRVNQSIGEGLLASGGEVVAAPAGAAPVSTETCTTAACLSAAARAAGASYLLRGTVEEEGRSYTFKLELLDGQSGAVVAQRENRCEICTDSEALETANTAASALKTQAFKRAPLPGVGPPAPPPPAPRASGDPRVRVTVFDRLELPASLEEFHGKLRTALEALIREQGLEVVAPPRLPANCAWAGCAEDLIRSTRASHVLFVEGSRNDYGFSLDLTLRAVAGEDSEKAQGWCNFCTGPQMVTAAENVARPLVAHLAARPEPRAGGAAAAPGAPGGGGEGRGGSSTGRLIAGIGLMVAGAASIAGGAYFWDRDGDLAECMPNPGGQEDPVCPSMQKGKGLGLGMMIGGAVAIGAGGWLAFFRNTSVAVSTNSVSVSGRF
jgi:hypothetical protein